MDNAQPQPQQSLVLQEKSDVHLSNPTDDETLHSSETPQQTPATLPPSLPPQDQTDPPTSSLPDLAQYRAIRLEQSGLSLSNPNRPFGSKDCMIVGECNWNVLTQHHSTTPHPPPPLRPGVDPIEATFITFHPRRWHCSEKQANYRRLLSPNAEEFKSLITAMDYWETSKFCFKKFIF